MGLKQIDYGSEEYIKMVALRNQILRKPLGLEYSDDELAQEKKETLIAAFEEDEILGCCVLSNIGNGRFRLRQMAVKNEVQGKGIGASIMSFAETIAKDKGFKFMVLHARETAVGFYEKFGYKVVGDVFIEVNLPHYLMEKELT
jgi:predicted GNAT family N-acyltransferase